MKYKKSISCYVLILLLVCPTLLYSYSCPSEGISSQIVSCSESFVCIDPNGNVINSVGQAECLQDQDNVWVNSSSAFSVELDLLPTAQFTLPAWFDENVNLWTIFVNNLDQSKMWDGSDPDYALKFELLQGSDRLVSAYYIGEDLSSTDILYNSDFSGDGNSSICGWEEDAGFTSQVQENQYLPAGEYTLTLTLYPKNTAPSTAGAVEWCNFGITDTEVLSNVLKDKIELSDPYPMKNVLQQYPEFTWYSPGFRPGINIDYRIIVSQYISSGSMQDALDNPQLLFFDSGWDYPGISNVVETGESQLMSVLFPSGDRDLACGHEYVWIVQARETIEGGTPLWGWEYGSGEVKSSIQSFYFGSKITSDKIYSPAIASSINTILPTFAFEASCPVAPEYEIWVGNSDDPEVENPIWQSPALPSPGVMYPDDAIALKPGEKYFWKARLNPDDPSPWSEVFSFSMEDIDLSQPSNGELLETVIPSFMVSGPNGIASYELRISDSNDPQVESANIFSQEVSSFPFEFPSSSDIGLLADETYFWKIVALDNSGYIIGDIDSYDAINSFKIQSISLSSPNDNMESVSLNPFFDWEGPNFSSYRFYLSEDISFDDPLLSQSVGTNSFLQCPENLQPNTTYYWKIQSIDGNGNSGKFSAINQFVTGGSQQADQAFGSNLNQQIDFNVEQSSENNQPTIIVTILSGIESADSYTALISENPSMGESQEFDISIGTPLYYIADEWSKSFYIKIVTDTEQSSDIAQISSPNFPGSDEQVSIDISLETGSLQPQISISSFVAGAIRYKINIANSDDMSNIIFSQFINESDVFIYPLDAPSLLYGQTYYIQCLANIDSGNDSSIHGIPSQVLTLFIPNIVPPIPENTLFSWGPTTPESDFYQFQISFTEDFSVIEYNQDGLSATSLDVNSVELSSGTSYYWRVRGLNELGDPFGQWSNPKYFETEGDAASTDVELEIQDIQIEIEAPLDGEELTSTNPIFAWKEVADAEKYQIQVAKNNEFSEIMWSNQNISTNSVEYPSSGAEPLEPGEQYFWRVRAYLSELSVSQYSTAFSFTATNDNTPVLTGPLGQAESILPFFSWDRIKDAENYLLIISTNEGMSAVILEKNDVSDVQFQYTSSSPTLEYLTNYYWTVTALDADSQPIGNPSLTGSFTTPSGEIELEFNYGDE